MFADRARVHVKAGRGGDGVVSFRREAHVPRGGPDGGDGGHGGDVAVVCDPSKRDLAALRHSPHVRAGKGEHGKGAQKHGARGEDREVAVPPGTWIAGLEGEVHDLLEPGQRVTVAHGGGGGHGNKRFASSTRQAPRFAESGLEGESGWLELRLKLLADAGFVGLPNAGKSSLLRRLTRAAPKVAGYPFTTVDPVLGTLETDDRQLVLADIPGLIEGAARGAGLGDEFLAHVERCRALLHVVDLAPPEGSPDPFAAHEIVRGELAEHGAGLEALPELILLSKRDLLPVEEAEAAVGEWRERFEAGALGVIAVSSATGEGIDELRGAILGAVPEQEALKEGSAAPAAGAAGAPAAPAAGAAGAPAGAGRFGAGSRFEAEHITYRPDAEQGFDVEPEDGAFRVRGRGIEVLVRRHDLSNPEALAYLEQRLREIGVVRALERAGFEPGDEVRIGEEALELEP